MKSLDKTFHYYLKMISDYQNNSQEHFQTLKFVL
jgi:hypothetical protein